MAHFSFFSPLYFHNNYTIGIIKKLNFTVQMIFLNLLSSVILLSAQSKYYVLIIVFFKFKLLRSEQ